MVRAAGACPLSCGELPARSWDASRPRRTADPLDAFAVSLDVVSAVGLDEVSPRAADDPVAGVAIARVEAVGTGTAVELVAAGAADQHIVTGASDQHVVSEPAR